jgi:hypothetical protein
VCHGTVTSRSSGKRTPVLGHDGNENLIGDHIPTIRLGADVIGSITTSTLEMRSVPVDQHVLFDNGCSGTSLEGFDVWNGEFEMGRMVETFGISTGTVVGVRSIVGANVVGFSVIVPSDDFEELEFVLEFENLFPSVVPKGLGVEEPVLGVGYFFTKVGEDYGLVSEMMFV